MRLSDRDRCLAAIAEAGAELLECADSSAAFDVSAWTPPGVVWVATGCHVVTGYDFGSRPAGWRCLREDLALGVEACTAVACDTCNP